MLEENGGPFTMSKNWLNMLCRSLNLTMRTRTTAAQKLPDDWEEKVLRMNQRVAVLAHKYSIPKDLVINLDQTGIHFIPTTDRGRAQRVAREIAMIGGEDKRQITGILAVSAANNLLPPQLNFQGIGIPPVGPNLHGQPLVQL